MLSCLCVYLWFFVVVVSEEGIWWCLCLGLYLNKTVRERKGNAVEKNEGSNVLEKSSLCCDIMYSAVFLALRLKQ